MAAATASTATRPPRPWRPRVALTVLLTASFTLAVDFSILNVALPSIGAGSNRVNGFEVMKAKAMTPALTIPTR